MLHMIVNTHNAESCAFRGDEEAQRLVGAIERFEESAPGHGLGLQGSWVNRASHEIFILVDAPNAHAIEEALLDAGVVGRTHSKVLPVISTEQAKEE
jgi:hypothetical protein